MEKPTNNSDILLQLIEEYRSLDIVNQVDYDKFCLYSLITHSTAIEGSTVTEIENKLLFDEGISAKGRSMGEQLMNMDLKSAYEYSMQLAKQQVPLSVKMLTDLSVLVTEHIKNLRQEIRNYRRTNDFDPISVHEEELNYEMRRFANGAVGGIE